MSNVILEPLKLTRKDGKIVDAVYYNNFDIDEVETLNIRTLKFEGMKTKDIRKIHIKKVVFQDKNKQYFQNNRTKIVAGLSKTHLEKFISTVFTRDSESQYSYLKKEIISNIDLIFYSAIPIIKHPELKREMLYDTQIIHRFALPLKIGGLTFFVMITIKERIDYEEMSIDEFSIYDLYSEKKENKKSSDSSSTVSKRTFRSQYQMNNEKPFDSSSMVSAETSSVTSLSHCQMVDTYTINDLLDFVKINVKNYQQ